tara:strand:- start:808 stop:1293 length:486 start_codon:yes stop_codon:yes gene_type:complete
MTYYGESAADPANEQISQDLLTGGFNDYQMQYLAPHLDFNAGMMASPGMSGGGALGGLVRGMQSQARPGFQGLVQGEMPASISKHAVPGAALPQMAPNTPAGLSVAGTNNMPTPANQSATMTVKTTPTGENFPAGSIMKSKYPTNNLRRLMNGAGHGRLNI